MRVHCDGRILMIQSMPSLEGGDVGWIDRFIYVFVSCSTRVLFEKKIGLSAR